MLLRYNCIFLDYSLTLHKFYIINSKFLVNRYIHTFYYCKYEEEIMCLKVCLSLENLAQGLFVE